MKEKRFLSELTTNFHRSVVEALLVHAGVLAVEPVVADKALPDSQQELMSRALDTPLAVPRAQAVAMQAQSEDIAWAELALDILVEPADIVPQPADFGSPFASPVLAGQLQIHRQHPSAHNIFVELSAIARMLHPLPSCGIPLVERVVFALVRVASVELQDTSVESAGVPGPRPPVAPLVQQRAVGLQLSRTLFSGRLELKDQRNMVSGQCLVVPGHRPAVKLLDHNMTVALARKLAVANIHNPAVVDTFAADRIGDIDTAADMPVGRIVETQQFVPAVKQPRRVFLRPLIVSCQWPSVLGHLCHRIDNLDMPPADNPDTPAVEAPCHSRNCIGLGRNTYRIALPDRFGHNPGLMETQDNSLL